MIENGKKRGILEICLYNESNEIKADIETIKKTIEGYTFDNINQDAENEDEEAQFVLGVVYKYGMLSQTKDTDKARYWYNKSLENDYSLAELIKIPDLSE